MKNITLSADEILIEKAREKARKEHTTLNQRFRDWLREYTLSQNIGEDYEAFMKKTEARTNKKFTRQELNER